MDGAMTFSRMTPRKKTFCSDNQKFDGLNKCHSVERHSTYCQSNVSFR